MEDNRNTLHSEGLRKSGIKRLIEIYLVLIIQAVIFFVAAGRIDIPRAWIFFGISFVLLIFNTILTLFFFPQLANIRGERRKGTKSWDRVFAAAYSPLILLLPLMAGLDVGRFGWSYLSIPFAIIGVILYIIAAILVDWAMITNTYFETTVRIQKDRDQKVITTGPYKIMRHPGYVAMILLNLSTPLVLGSCFALIPAGVIAVLFIIRTALEDKTLQEELTGYTEYTKQTGYRLIPGIW